LALSEPSLDRPKRLTRDDWLVQALAQLTAIGPEGVRLEAICDSLGKTRGSFYHHFEDHDAFVAQMMTLWRDMNTDDVIDLIEAQADLDPSELAEFADDLDADLLAEITEQVGGARGRLNQIAALMDHQVEQAIRRFALARPAAMAVVEEIDQRRIGFLARLTMQQFQIDEAQATALAEIEYATFVGCQHLFPDASPERLEAIGTRVDRMIALAASDFAKSGDADDPLAGV
jgi:AcrR family transcriptional regulator